MIDIKQFTIRLKHVKIQDILSVFPMILGFFFSLLFRIRHDNIWLICERKNEARDNGYWFFKYMCENHPEIEAVYAINKKGIDYNRVKDLGKTIQFGSINHWVYYFAAKKNISSQKEGKPNAALCFFLEIYLGVRNNRYFLQHGIIKNSMRWLFYDISKYRVFCTSAIREKNYIETEYGYPEKAVKLVGLCRFDNLITPHVIKKQVLVMPTMREWLRVSSLDTVFLESEYYRTWNHFLRSKELEKVLSEYNYSLIFYLHPAFQNHSHLFISNNPLITIGSDSDNDMQQLLMESSVLITDYSSICFDFAYMDKPLVYYQFDKEKYRKDHYQEGYSSYESDGFGPVVEEEGLLINNLESILKKNCEVDIDYRNRAHEFFAFRDNHNCERTYQAFLEQE